MIRRLGLVLSIVLVVLIAGGIISWAVETPAEQRERELHQELQRKRQLLDQKINLKPPPDYTINTDTIDSSAHPCDREVDTCMVVYTEGNYDAKGLASITRSILSDPNYPTGATSIQFVDGISMEDTGMSFCFEDKDVAASVLRGELDNAALLGKTDNCYIAVYEDSGPDL